MPVFKAYLLIIRKNVGLLLMYLGIVVTLAVMMTLVNRQSPTTSFLNTKVNVAVFNEDKTADSWLTESLIDYLQTKANLIEILDDTEAIKDALYFEKIVYVVRIPQGFTDQFATENPLSLEQSAAPNSTSAIYLEMMIDKYLNTLHIFNRFMPGESPEKIVSLTLENLSITTPVEMKTTQVQRGTYDNIVYYYNYLAYALLSILILGVSTCMLAFNNLDLRRRNLCSPISLRSMSLQLVAGNLIFSLFSWLILVLISFMLYPAAMLTPNGALFAVNAFVFMLVGLTLSFLIGNALKSRNAQSAVSNVVTLGSSFISGVFVPQAFLGKTVLAIAQFTPTFWFVKANIAIGSFEAQTLAGAAAIWPSILVQFGFAALFLIAAVVLIRIRRQKAN